MLLPIVLEIAAGISSPVVALPGVGARVAGTLGEWAVRQGIGEARVPAVPPADPSVAEGTKEKELLEALARRGKLTAVGAALQTPLSVEEADRMLRALAAKDHLEVTVEHGSLVYALWERDSS